MGIFPEKMADKLKTDPQPTKSETKNSKKTQQQKTTETNNDKSNDDE